VFDPDKLAIFFVQLGVARLSYLLIVPLVLALKRVRARA
jgi:hypothetical protein